MRKPIGVSKLNGKKIVIYDTERELALVYRLYVGSGRADVEDENVTDIFLMVDEIYNAGVETVTTINALKNQAWLENLSSAYKDVAYDGHSYRFSLLHNKTLGVIGWQEKNVLLFTINWKERRLDLIAPESGNGYDGEIITKGHWHFLVKDVQSLDSFGKLLMEVLMTYKDTFLPEKSLNIIDYKEAFLISKRTIDSGIVQEKIQL